MKSEDRWKTCAQCEINFYIPLSQNFNTKFCGDPCRREYTREYMKIAQRRHREKKKRRSENG